MPGRRSVEAIWYTGRMMGETVAYNICGKAVAYDPGLWFNSAKFIDIEYQVYGEVPAKLPEHLKTIFWMHPDGCLLYTSPSPRDRTRSRMPSSA